MFVNSCQFPEAAYPSLPLKSIIIIIIMEDEIFESFELPVLD